MDLDNPDDCRGTGKNMDCMYVCKKGRKGVVYLRILYMTPYTKEVCCHIIFVRGVRYFIKEK